VLRTASPPPSSRMMLYGKNQLDLESAIRPHAGYAVGSA
jgi:hypothetical protein